MRQKYLFFSSILLFSIGAALSPAADSAPPPDVCKLLTNAQITAVIGTQVGICESSLDKIFTWTDSASSGDAQRKVIVVLISMQGYDAGKATVNGIVKHPLTGVGDEAYSMSSKFATTIHFKTEDLAFSVEVRAKDLSADQLILMEKSIGQQIAAKR